MLTIDKLFGNHSPSKIVDEILDYPNKWVKEELIKQVMNPHIKRELLSRLVAVSPDFKEKYLIDYLFDSFGGFSAGAMSRAMEKKSPFEKKVKAYPYISFRRWAFMFLMKEVLEKHPEIKSFIDVGSGICDKPIIMSYINPLLECYGIEYNKQTHQIGDYLIDMFGRSKRQSISYVTNIKGDAYKHNYSKYDLIYLYCPMQTKESMSDLYKVILRTMKVGSYMIEVFHIALFEFLIPTLEEIEGKSFCKILQTDKVLIKKVGANKFEYESLGREDAPWKGW